MRFLSIVVILAGSAHLAAQTRAPIVIALDPSFGNGGFVTDHLDGKASTSDLGRWLSVDQEGRPVIAGNSTGQRFAISRYTTDGRPDNSFAGNGKAAICIEAPTIVESAGNAEVQFTHGGVIDAQGRIVIVGKGAGSDGGRWETAVLHFLPDGQLDKSFSEVGYRKYPASEVRNIGLAVAVADDSLVVACYALPSRSMFDPVLLRLDETGAVDQAFTAAASSSLRRLAGERMPATPTGVAIDKKGRCVVGMNLQDGRGMWSVARLMPSGQIDESFGNGGIWKATLDPSAAEELTFSTSLDPAGRIVLGGYSEDDNGLRRLAVARITDRGQADPSFGPAGKGRVILDGYGANVTYRYGPRAAVMSGRIAIAGSLNGKGNGKCFGLAVLDETGQDVAKIEPRLFLGSKGTDQPWGVAFDGDGRVLVGGASQAISGKWRFAVARYDIK